MQRSLREIAQLLSAELIGADAPIRGVAPLELAEEGEVSLCLGLRQVENLRTTKASAVMLPRSQRSLAVQAPCAVLLVEEPRASLMRVLECFHPPVPVVPGISPDAWVDPSAQVAPSACVERAARLGREVRVGERTMIASGASLDEGAHVGEDCRIGVNAVVAAHCVLGDRVMIGPGAVIGADGFGFVEEHGRRRKLPQVGTVLIEDDVEIGANTTVARATLGVTRIGRGTKIDCLVHVAHNVTIGPSVVIAAQVGLSGSVRIEEGALLGGQVGVSDHIVIGRGAQVAAKSGVGVHVEPGARVAGYPALPVKDWLQSVFLWRRLKRRHKSSHSNGSEA